MCSLAFGAPVCSSGPLTNYLNLGTDGCILGTSIVSTFTIFPGSTGATAINPATVSVVPTNSGSAPQLAFTTTASAGANQLSQMILGYKISGSTFTSNTMTVSGTTTSGGGSTTAIQNYCLGGTFVPNPPNFPGICSGSTSGSLLVLSSGSDSVAFAPVTSIALIYDLTLDGGPNGSASGATVSGQFAATSSQPPVLPSVGATGPVSSTGISNTFLFRFDDPNGFQNLGVVNALLNRSLDGGRACYIAYSQPTRTLFLVNDDGPNSGLSAGLVLGGANSVSNSQCQINGAGSSAVGSGNTLTLAINITFRPAFSGSQVVYLAARDIAGNNSGWSTMGFHVVPGAVATFPNAVGQSPATGNVPTSIISFDYEDQVSAGNIRTTWSLINSALDGSRACYVAFFNPGNLVLLIPDSGDGAVAQSFALGSAGSIENSQCRINSQGSFVTRSGARLTLTLNITFKPSFAGNKATWLALQTLSNQTSVWKAAGAWQVPP